MENTARLLTMVNIHLKCHYSDFNKKMNGLGCVMLPNKSDPWVLVEVIGPEVFGEQKGKESLEITNIRRRRLLMVSIRRDNTQFNKLWCRYPKPLLAWIAPAWCESCGFLGKEAWRFVRLYATKEIFCKYGMTSGEHHGEGHCTHK